MAIDRVALMVSGFEGGGVERNFTNLALGLDRLGIETGFMVGDPHHAYLSDLAGSGVRVLPVKGSRTGSIRDLLQRHRPDVLMTGKLVDDFAAIAARAELPGADRDTRLVAAVGTLLSGRFAAHPWNPFKRLRDIRRIRAQYERLDGITAISGGVATDLERVFGIRGTPIRVLNNPIIPAGIESLAAAPCPHPWLGDTPPDTTADDRPPVLIAVGGLRRVKGYDTLLKAFARLPDPAARLLILGEGKERDALQGLARRLGITDRIELHGFIPNPYPYIARARLLVLSSIREGLGNVVIEAMALATPVVATNCSHGLSELTSTGALGPLVPPSDPGALARAIANALSRSVPRDVLIQATGRFGIDPAARAHLDFFRWIDTGPDRTHPV